MINHDVKQWFEDFYPFVEFAQATGLKSPLVAQAYNDFRDFTIELQKTDGNGYYGYDGIISEAFEQWMQEQTKYPID